jgi:3-hydroxyisobutyrate dehydrogenase
MATHLALHHEVIGFDVNPERLSLAELAGVRAADSPAKACAGADVVLIGVRDAAQLESALFGPSGASETLAEGAVVILTSTVGRDAARDAARRLDELHVHLIDAPVSGGPVRAGEGDLLIMVGGDAEALAQGTSVLRALASTLTVAGPRVGDGQMLKTVNQLLCGVHTAAAAEALALAHALGLDLDSTLEVLGKGAAASFMLSDRGPRIVQQLTGSRPMLRSRLDVISKDMGIVARLAREAKVATPVAGAAGQLFLLGEALGFSAEDDSVISTTLHTPSTESAS